VTVNLPAFTSNPPQLHHKKTTSNHPFSPKPPAKTGSHHPQKITAEHFLIRQVLRFSGDDYRGDQPAMNHHLSLKEVALSWVS
jgi:hypothetical protein